MFEQISIRHAAATDLSALLALSVNSFQDTFEDENNTADIAAYIQESFSLDKLQAEFSDVKSTFLLMVPDGEIPPIGYAKLHTGTPEKGVTGSQPIELVRLYLDKRAIGKGLGAQLMQACLTEAAKQGYETIWLGVWEHNTRALAFYRRWQFEVVGSHIFQLGADAQNDLIMQRPISITTVA